MEKRRFSVEDDFMKTRANAVLYTFMRCISTLNSRTKEEYLYKETFQENIEIARDLCWCSTTKTINNNLKKLISVGLIKEDIKNDKPCYTFPYDEHGIYKLIELPLLKFILNSRNKFGVRTYLYLLNKSTYKENYTFTIKELSTAFGFSQNTTYQNEAIKDSLIDLQYSKLIDYEDAYQQVKDPRTGKIVPSPIKILKFVATSLPDHLKEKSNIPVK